MIIQMHYGRGFPEITLLHKRIKSNSLILFSLYFISQMRNWKRRYFLLEENAMSYFKSDLVIKCVL